MCGRFTLTAEMQAIAEQFGEMGKKLAAISDQSAGRFGKPNADGRQPIASNTPRWNICPAQPVIVILNNGKLEVSQARWGLIPAWATDPSIGNKLANARAEGIEAKPSFRTPFKRKRCLVLADGFYEWKQTTPKTPHYFRLKNKAVFAFAGLWDVWRDPTGAEAVTCCLITTTPNTLVKTVHDRMPVILQQQFYDLWLSEAAPPVEQLQKVLVPYPADEMEGFPVSNLVNKPQNDLPECIQPVERTPHERVTPDFFASPEP